MPQLGYLLLCNLTGKLESTDVQIFYRKQNRVQGHFILYKRKARNIKVNGNNRNYRLRQQTPIWDYKYEQGMDRVK